MALRIISGVIEEIGAVSGLSRADGPTGLSWTFVRFRRERRRTVVMNDVIADATIGARLALQQTGRFAFYPYGKRFILCGFAGSGGFELATLAKDPAAIEAEAIRTPAKRKILLGVMLIPTIIGLFFAFDMIKAGRATLREHPAPKRPPEGRLTRALKGQFYWPL